MAGRASNTDLLRPHSVVESRFNSKVSVFDQRLVNLRLEDSSSIQYPSPSLKRVIKPNVVQLRKQEFERISQIEKGNVGPLSKRGVCGRQVKSDSSVDLNREKEVQRSFGEFVPPSVKQPIHQPMRTMSLITSEFKGDDSEDGVALPRGKPQPKPTVLQKRNPSSGIDSSVLQDSKPSSVSFPQSYCCTDANKAFHSSDDNNNNSNDLAEGLHQSSKLEKSAVLPTPPPKPPRNLFEVTRETQHEVEQIESGAYDHLANATSIVLPTVIPEAYSSPSELIESGETSTPKQENKALPTSSKVEKLSPLYSEVKPRTSVKKQASGSKITSSFGKKKKSKSGKTVQVDNPSYIYKRPEAKDDIIPSSLLGKNCNKSAFDQNPGDRSQDQHEELIYAEPYMETRVVFPPSCQLYASIDGDGYAIPDVDNNALQQKAQSKAKSKVSHAYEILRLPNEAGDSVQLEDSAEDLEDKDLNEHLIYVRKVRQKTRDAIEKYEQVKLKSTVRLFQSGLIIGMDSSDQDGFKPKVLFRIPEKVEESDAFVCNFCFPDVDFWTDKSQYEGEELFSFVLTNETGDRRYGWCRRYLPSGTGTLPEALCILSSIGEFGMYEQLLRTVVEFRSYSMECATDLMEVAYARPMPAPNREVYIRTENPIHGRQNIILQRASTSDRSIVPFQQLLVHLGVPNLIQVFGALLLERKIIFCASRLSTLSSCICAVMALLYPFEWQHTYVTVLPSSLIDIVEAPTPFVIGLLSSMKSCLEDHDITEVLFVDLDNRSLSSGVGDESRILPKKKKVPTATLR